MSTTSHEEHGYVHHTAGHPDGQRSGQVMTRHLNQLAAAWRQRIINSHGGLFDFDAQRQAVYTVIAEITEMEQSA